MQATIRIVRIWDVATGTESSRFGGFKSFGSRGENTGSFPGVVLGVDSVRSAAFSPDGRLIVTADSGGAARIWDASTGKELRLLQGYSNPQVLAAFLPDSRSLVTTGQKTPATLWDLELGQPTRRFSPTDSEAGDFLWHPTLGQSPNGTLLALAGASRVIHIWNASTGEKVRRLEGHSQYINDITYCPDSTRLLKRKRGRDRKPGMPWDGQRLSSQVRMQS